MTSGYTKMFLNMNSKGFLLYRETVKPSKANFDDMSIQVTPQGYLSGKMKNYLLLE